MPLIKVAASRSKTNIDTTSIASEDRIYKEMGQEDDEEEGEGKRKENKSDDEEDLDKPGGGDDQRDSDKWENFESQYSLAIQQSIFIEREKWGNPIEFLLSCIASSVGLGNIWRFPFIAGDNGGGAFLIPYFLVIIVIARPLFFLELSWGQFCSGGPVRAWECAPIFKGVAYSQTVVSFLTASFYMVIMSWTLMYLAYSFFSPLPFAEDPPQFFENEHLKIDLEEFKEGRSLGCPPDWKLLLSLLSSWFMVWLIMVRGVSGSGKIAYFTALFPYLILIILLVRGATLTGAGEGMLFFIQPDLEKLTHGDAWFQAVSQCFFSLGISFGGLVMFSSFNQFKHRLGRDVWIVSIMDTFTSLLAGITIFGILGNLAIYDNARFKFDPKNITSISGRSVMHGAFEMTFVNGTFNMYVTKGKLTGPDKDIENHMVLVKDTFVNGTNYTGFKGHGILDIKEEGIYVIGKGHLHGNIGFMKEFIDEETKFNRRTKTQLKNLTSVTLKVDGKWMGEDSVLDTIKKLAKAGAGLAFVAYPSALAQFGDYPLPQIFSFLFFFMILVLALGSANGLVGNVVTVICDRNSTAKRWKILTIVCLAGFFAGIMYTTPAGVEMIDLVDKYGSEVCLFILAFVEIVGVAWVYGMKNVMNDIEFMLDQKVSMYYPICWGILIPFSLIGIFVFYITTFQPPSHWPLIANIFGWLLSAFVLVMIPGVAIYTVMTRKSRFFRKRFLASIHPSRKWGPKDPTIKEAWRRNRNKLPNEFRSTTAVKNFLRRLFRRPIKQPKFAEPKREYISPSFQREEDQQSELPEESGSTGSELQQGGSAQSIDNKSEASALAPVGSLTDLKK